MHRPSARTLTRFAAVALALVVGVAAVAAGSVVARYRSIDREHFRDGALADGSRAEPQNFLVVGTDSRRFVDDAGAAAAFGTPEQVGEPHADTILLVRTFPKLDRVAIVSFPRDLFVTVAGTGREERINTALQGGPERLVRTLAENFGVPVNHFVEVDFRGFQALVDAIGGVTINFPAPARDWDEDKQVNPTGLEISRPGCVELGGHQALAWVRSRNFQQLVDGQWRPDPAGDLNRMTRQQEFIRTAVEQSMARGLRSPSRVNALIDVAVDNVTLDDGLGFRDLTALSRQFRDIEPASLQSYSLPTVPGTTAGGAQVLFLDGPSADPILDVFRGKTTAAGPVTPSAVRVRVLHGPARAGAAEAAAFRLAAAGFVLEPTAASDGRPAKTVIEYPAGGERKAELLRARLAGPVELRPSGSVRGVDAALTVGQDWRGVVEAGATPAATATAPPGDQAQPAAPTPGPAPAPTPSC